MKNCLTQKNPKMCDPVLVTLLKLRPHYSQSSRENATPPSGTSPLASYKEVLGILSFLPFSFSQKFSYFVSDSREYHFFSSLVNKQLGNRAWKRGWSMVFCPSSLVFNQIYHDPFTSFPIKYTIESKVYCSHLPKLVSVGWFWRLSRRIGANPKRKNNSSPNLVPRDRATLVQRNGQRGR